MCWACQQDPWAGFIHPTARWNEAMRRACARKAERTWDNLDGGAGVTGSNDERAIGELESGSGDERSH